MTELVASPYRPPTVNGALGRVTLKWVAYKEPREYLYDARLGEYRLVDEPGADPIPEDRVCPDCGQVTPLCNWCEGWAYHWWMDGDQEYEGTPPPMVRPVYPGGEVYICESHCGLLTEEFHDNGDTLVAYGSDDCEGEDHYDPWH